MRFYISDQSNPIDERHDLWNRPLPTSRQGNPQAADEMLEWGLTYGEYFSAVEAFVNAYPKHFHIDNSSVYLEKHGAFYHPGRIAVDRQGCVDEYVVNVAFSKAGRQYLENEYNTLKMLYEKYGYSFLPRVFACRETPVDSARTASLFSGEWFGSYHEFHVNGTAPHDFGNVRVWDPANANRFLSRDQALHVYAQAAMILTACYDLQTFEQISAWHHAAGDFVVNLEDPQAPGVKLITVRRYAPLIEAVENSAEAMMNGLLLFLLSLSLHMRLDRRDGVKEICWLPDIVVEATLTGFFQGLALQQKAHCVPDDFIVYWKSFLSDIDLETLKELFMAVAHRFPAEAPDTPFIRSHIEEHINTFHKSLRLQL